MYRKAGQEMSREVVAREYRDKTRTIRMLEAKKETDRAETKHRE